MIAMMCDGGVVFAWVDRPPHCCGLLCVKRVEVVNLVAESTVLHNHPYERERIECSSTPIATENRAVNAERTLDSAQLRVGLH